MGLTVALLGLACGGAGGGPSDPSGPSGPTGPTGPTGPGSSSFTFGTPGPWPVANQLYGAADGIRESPVVALTTDEAQNRWIATPGALYLAVPGAPGLRRFDGRDGLHFQGNALRYCNGRQMVDDRPCAGREAWGQGEAPGIKTIAGGGPNEVFVGYHGRHTEGIDCAGDGSGQDDCDPLAHSGKIDRVRLRADGTLQVDRLDLVAINHGGKYWHDRTIHRLVYDHLVRPHTLYAGTEHGVTMLLPDRFRLPDSGEWWNDAYKEWMGDHLHARVCWERPCDGTASGQRMGDWLGLAIDANGDLWHAGRWTAGLISWDPDPVRWFARNGAAFKAAFGDPYLGPGSSNPPVFPVAKEGHSVFLSSVSVCPDGRVWFGSLGPDDGVEPTIASYGLEGFRYYTTAEVGLPERPVRDLVCLPDGRLAIANPYAGVVLWDPSSGASTPLRAGSGLPSDVVLALELDAMPSPPTLHVATASGAAALRVLP
jgi:hypothetical protein